MKTYVLRISKHFMKSHPRAGQETDFRRKILKCGAGFQTAHDSISGFTIHSRPWPIMMPDDIVPKLHTIRENYDYWSHVAEEVNAGRAILSLRQWAGKPFRSKCGKEQEFLHLTKMGVQRIRIEIKGQRNSLRWPVVFFDGDRQMPDEQWPLLARNDGFKWEHDLLHWFGWEPMDGCIIHFTDFRY